jgi:hypothetical protein
VAKYRVYWSTEVIKYWTGTVEAESQGEAMEVLKQGDVDYEELMDETDGRVRNHSVEGLEEE